MLVVLNSTFYEELGRGSLGVPSRHAFAIWEGFLVLLLYTFFGRHISGLWLMTLAYGTSVSS
jgi:hypothetical protein